MLVSHAFYQVFYHLLCEQFLKRGLNGTLPHKAKTIHSPLIWSAEYTSGDKKGKNIALDLFEGGRTSDHQHFYRKFSEFKSKRTAVVDDLALYKALRFLAGSDEKPSANIRPDRLKVELATLYDDFMNRHQQEILNVELTNINPATRLPLSSEENAQLKDVLKEAADMINNDIEHVKGVIKTFYDSISTKAFSEAWKKLSPSFQQRTWQEDYDRFAGGYVNTRGIRNLSITDARQSSTYIIDCSVAYEDEIEAYISPEIDALNGMAVKDVEEFVRQINSLRAKIEAGGGTGFEKIELSRFFEPAASEYIWFKCNIQPDKLSDVFSRQKTVFVKRNYLCSCHMIEGNWYIERVRALATYSTR